jgi:hypothetical protein
MSAAFEIIEEQLGTELCEAASTLDGPMKTVSVATRATAPSNFDRLVILAPPP